MKPRVMKTLHNDLPSAMSRVNVFMIQKHIDMFWLLLESKFALNESSIVYESMTS